jgi:uncharacterized protein YndB with AHSA1/START domain
VTTDRHGSSAIEFPSDLEILVTREFQAPIALVFDVLWKPEHLRKTIAPFGEEVTVCEVDLRAGGDYRYVFVTDEGIECSFRGTFLRVEPPTRTVQTWLFDGWPDTEAVETFELAETEEGTRLSWRLAFRDQAGRDHMTKFDGIEASFDNLESYLTSLLDQEAAAAE